MRKDQFNKVIVALNHLKSSLDTNESKIKKQIGLIKKNAGTVDHKNDNILVHDWNESEDGDMKISDRTDPHDIVILPDIDVEEEGDEFNLSLMI